MRLAPLALAALMLATTTPAALATDQDDAGLGADAPDTLGSAAGLALGSHSGQLSYDGGDKEDWYRVATTVCPLQLTFQATSGSMWVGIYQDDGTLVTNAFNNGPLASFVEPVGAYRIGFGDQNGVGSATYSFSAVEDTHDGQDDAGLGCDAPGVPGSADDVALGTHTGQLLYSSGDKEDWLRVSSPCGSLSMSYRGNLFGGIYSDSGALVSGGGSGNGGVHLSAPSGTYKIGLGDQSGSGSAGWTLTLATSGYHDEFAGCDVGNALGAANGNVVGSASGSLDPASDAADWYRFAASPCAGLSVSLSASSGSLDAALYTDAGAFVRDVAVGGGAVQLADLGQGAYRLALASPSAALTYSFSVAPLENDAGTGCDAPNSLSSAMNVNAGWKAGATFYALGDKEDWYRFAASPCGKMKVTMSVSAGSAWAGVYGDDGTFLANQRLGAGGSVTYNVVASAFRLGLGDSAQATGAATYSFTITVVSTDPTGASCLNGPTLVPA